MGTFTTQRNRRCTAGSRRSMRTAVIIATYEQTRELDLCLRGWGRQSVAPTWIVVADDGSGPAIAEIAARHGARHLRLDPRGDRERFGKCAAVNASVRTARDLGCDHLLFTDADCLPARTLLERHQRAAHPCRFVAG